MKKLIPCIALLIYAGFAGVGGFAVEKTSLPTGWSKLKLSPEQVSKISSIRIASAKQVKEMQEQLKAIKEKAQEDAVAVLTDPQKQALADSLNAKAGLKKGAPK